MTLQTRVAAALEALGVREDDSIGVACSGGADSIALLHLLAGRRNVVALHVDHNLRSTSASDAAFVSETAARLGMSFRAKSVAVEDAPRTSVEAVARTARYEALSQMAHQVNLRFVATAHTRDDQAETVLLRLMRGDTLDSIAPVRDIFVRPLLDVGGDELRAWLTERAIGWREDETNEDQRFERNWVRHTLLPLMRQRRPGVAKALFSVAGRALVDERALDEMAAAVLEDADVDDVGIFIPHIDLVAPAVVSRVIRAACRKLGLDPRSAEVDAIVHSRRGVVRCRTIDAWRLSGPSGGLALLKVPVAPPKPIVLRPGPNASAAWGIQCRLREGPRDGWRDGMQDLVIRSRRPGDRITTAAGTRKVQDVLVDAKVPRPLRDLVPVLADEHEAHAVMTRGIDADSALSGRVFDIRPYLQTWSRALVWTT